MTKRAYLDWNASSPVRPEARDAFSAALDRFGNPSSVHAEGRAARDLVEASREEVAAFMGCAPAEVVFTSGGGESNHLALHSLARSASSRSFAAARIEHSSIQSRLDALLAEGWRADWLPVSAEGFADPAAVAPGTGFACLQAANQESGALQPLREMSARCGELGVPWHCDAVQAWGKSRLTLKGLGCVTASLSGHKLGAPKGTGALYVAPGAAIDPLFPGGPQERGRRGGTENVPAIAALAAACRATARDLDKSLALARSLREKLISAARAACPDAWVNGPADESLRVPQTLSVSFPDVVGALLVPAMDLEGVAVSAGSACASGAVKPSGVLLAMGIPQERALGTLRVSTGWGTTDEDVARFGAALSAVLGRMAAQR